MSKPDIVERLSARSGEWAEMGSATAMVIPPDYEALEAVEEIKRLRPYVEAFHREKTRADRIENFLGDALVLLSSAPVHPDCDWKCGEEYARGPCDCGIRQWEDEKDALLAKLEGRS